MKENLIRKLKKGSKSFNIELTSEQISKIELFSEYILYWNGIVDITAHQTESEIVDYMFLDSLAFGVTGVDLNSKRVLDFGTGGGFPGVPLKIIYPDSDFSLLDASKNKCNFLRQCIKKLELEKIDVICGEGRNLGRTPEYASKFDLLLSRACADVGRLIKFSFPFLKVGGEVIMWKGPSWKKELEEATEVMQKYSATLSAEYSYQLHIDHSDRTLIFLKKNK